MVMVSVLVVVSCGWRRKRMHVADDVGVVFFYRVVDARGSPSKDTPCPRASVEELIERFIRHHHYDYPNPAPLPPMRNEGSVHKPANVFLLRQHTGGTTAHILRACQHVPQFQRTIIIFVASAALYTCSLYLKREWPVVTDVAEGR